MYVNDIIHIRHDQKEIIGLKAYLAKEFKIKDLGKLQYFL